jgi:hypothetical protein
MLGKKTDGAPHTCDLGGIDCLSRWIYGILHVFNTILYENEFQNPQIFQHTIILFPEQFTFLTIYITVFVTRGRHFGTQESV